MEGFIKHSECGCKGYQVVPIGNSGLSYDKCDIAWHREFMSLDKKVAVGLNDDGTIDEVLTDGAPLHIEQMSDDCFWMSVNHRYFFHMSYAKGKKVVFTYSEDIGV